MSTPQNPPQPLPEGVPQFSPLLKLHADLRLAFYKSQAKIRIYREERDAELNRQVEDDSDDQDQADHQADAP